MPPLRSSCRRGMIRGALPSLLVPTALQLPLSRHRRLSIQNRRLGVQIRRESAWEKRADQVLFRLLGIQIPMEVCAHQIPDWRLGVRLRKESVDKCRTSRPSLSAGRTNPQKTKMSARQVPDRRRLDVHMRKESAKNYAHHRSYTVTWAYKSASKYAYVKSQTVG